MILAIAGGIAWLTWPGHVLHVREKGGLPGLLTQTLPAVSIHVARGGTASMWAGTRRVPLPDTVLILGGTPATIRVENADTLAHRLGLFGVPAGSVREYTVAHAGVYGGYCSAHPARRLTYIVR